MGIVATAWVQSGIGQLLYTLMQGGVAHAANDGEARVPLSVQRSPTQTASASHSPQPGPTLDSRLASEPISASLPEVVETGGPVASACIVVSAASGLAASA